jgi:2-hydroxychromene-2-carboxylate isomerase
LATDKGIFGAPSFVIGKEIFWGNDRLEDALLWYKNL